MKCWMFVFAIALTACQQPSVDDGEVLPSDYETEGLAGPGDTRAFTTLEVDEPLRARYLKEMLCEAVTRSPDLEAGTRVTFGDNCLNHQFTVKKQHTSQRVVYANARGGLTVGLEVEIVGTNPAVTATGTLRRQFADDFELTWVASAVVNLNDDDRYLRRLAEESGEYFSGYEDTEFVDRVHLVPLGSLPAGFDTVIQNEITQIEAGFNRGDHATAGEAYRVDHPNGDTAGYVVLIDFSIDDPLYDGGGTTLYINTDGVVVESVDWWG